MLERFRQDFFKIIVNSYYLIITLFNFNPINFINSQRIAGSLPLFVRCVDFRTL